MDRWMDEWIVVSRWFFLGGAWMDGRMDSWYMFFYRWMDGWMFLAMDGSSVGWPIGGLVWGLIFMDGWMDCCFMISCCLGWMDEWMDG